MTKAKKFLLAVILASVCSFTNAGGTEADRVALVSTIKKHYPKTTSQLAAKVVELSISLTQGNVFTPEDVLAIAMVESGFKPNARNGISKGLMQVNKGSYDVETNMKQGVDLLVDYHSQLGSKRKAIQAYNVGISRYKRVGPKAGASYFLKVDRARRKFL